MMKLAVSTLIEIPDWLEAGKCHASKREEGCYYFCHFVAVYSLKCSLFGENVRDGRCAKCLEAEKNAENDLCAEVVTS